MHVHSKGDSYSFSQQLQSQKKKCLTKKINKNVQRLGGGFGGKLDWNHEENRLEEELLQMFGEARDLI